MAVAGTINDVVGTEWISWLLTVWLTDIVEEVHVVAASLDTMDTNTEDQYATCLAA